MTRNVKEKSQSSPTKDNEHLCHLILELQGAVEIDQLWRLFLQRFPNFHPVVIKEAELAYQAGILWESLAFFKDKFETARKTLNTDIYPDARKDSDFRLTAETCMIFKRIGGYSIKLEMKFENQDKTGPEENRLATLLRLFLNQVYLLLKIKNFEFHSIKDDITLAYNQNYLKAFMQNEIERSMRYASAFSVIFFDLDNLKAINEDHGHLVGTEVLKEVAGVLRGQVRKMDLLSRFGGDEFVIVLLHADSARAYEVCERIKSALKKTVFLKDKGLNINITGCFGISSFPENGNTVDDLIRNADIAMYEIKRTGKDGIKIYEGEK